MGVYSKFIDGIPSQYLAQAQLPGSGVGQSAGAGSPFNNYDAGIVVVVFLVAILVAIVLIGAFLLVNIGLLSKRPEDRTLVTRKPSDLGVLKNTVWPEAPYEENVLPAEEDENQALKKTG